MWKLRGLSTGDPVSRRCHPLATIHKRGYDGDKDYVESLTGLALTGTFGERRICRR